MMSSILILIYHRLQEEYHKYENQDHQATAQFEEVCNSL